jgi:Na+/melibiose symporter-like transporter
MKQILYFFLTITIIAALMAYCWYHPKIAFLVASLTIAGIGLLSWYTLTCVESPEFED